MKTQSQINRSNPKPLVTALCLMFGTGLGSTTVLAANAAPTPNESTPASNDKTVVRRFALLTGASQGGAERARLRFSSSDATAIRRVLSDLGGLNEADTTLILEVDRKHLQAGFSQLKEKIAAARKPGSRTEMVFYYSGHSDELGLLLGNERVSYPEIRSWVEATGADVRIAVLDSCASGAFTREKGGVHRPPFLVDTSSAARGHAYMTASAENEAAQESDRLGAAYFTHYLASGLRGAADVSHDGRVTLSEAYQYAFTETLARTESSRGGPQHASYDFQLAGKGDLVMTDLRATSASLILPPELAGRLFVRDSNGQLIAEVHKLPAQPIELGLPPGRYRVTLDDDRHLSETTVDLGMGRSLTLQRQQMVAMVASPSTLRGDDPNAHGADLSARAWPADNRESAGDAPINLSVYPGFDTVGGVPTNNKFVLGFFAESANTRGLSLTLGHYILHNGSGVDAAAFGTIRGGDFSGLSLTGVGDITRGNARGFLLAGIGNYVGGDLHGAAVSGYVNWTKGALVGLQMAGIANLAASVRGVQLGGIANISRGDVVGAQASGIANVANHANVRGVQMAGIANVANDSHITGAQVSGIANLANDLSGAQISLVNVGGNVNGTQIGIVNVSHKVRGLQFGLVNLADSVDGVSFGLVNLVRDGIHELDVSTTEIGGATISGLLGTRHFYTRLGVGVLAGANSIPGGRTVAVGSEAERKHYMSQVFLGGRYRVNDDWAVDTEFGTANYYDSQGGFKDTQEQMTVSFRMIATVRLASQFRLAFGPTFNTSIGKDGVDLVTSSGVGETVSRSGTTTFRSYPGFMLGMRI